VLAPCAPAAANFSHNSSSHLPESGRRAAYHSSDPLRGSTAGCVAPGPHKPIFLLFGRGQPQGMKHGSQLWPDSNTIFTIGLDKVGSEVSGRGSELLNWASMGANGGKRSHRCADSSSCRLAHDQTTLSSRLEASLLYGIVKFSSTVMAPTCNR
jgi:hypothetical protein